MLHLPLEAKIAVLAPLRLIFNPTPKVTNPAGPRKRMGLMAAIY